MKRVLIFLAIVLLAGAGYFTYDKWVKNSNLTIWSFVPQNAFFVYETPAPLSTLQDIRETAIWKNLSVLPAFEQMTEKINFLDTIVGQGAFSSSFITNPFLVSFHTVTSEEFDFLFIVEIQNLTQHAFLSKLQTNFTKKTRKYLNFTITELKANDSPESFTFIFYKNFFIGSFSAFLVEDAIRVIAYKETPSFSEAFPELKTVAKLERDNGNVYVNFERLTSVLSTFKINASTLNLGRSAYLDLKVTDDLINLSGFTFVDNPKQFLTPYRQQPGSSFNIPEIVPNEAASMLHIHLSNPKKFGADLKSQLNLTNPEVNKLRLKLKQEHDFDVEYTYDLLDEEIGIVALESAPERTEKLLILEIKDMGEALNHFNSAGERAAIASEDTVYVEYFGNYQIRKLPFDQFPFALLGEIGEGFDHTFYLQHRNYLIFSNSLLRLKNLTIGIENENTWGKSLRIRKFLDQMNQSANLSLFVNTSRSWGSFTKSLKESWRSLAFEYQYTFKNIEFLAFQFSAIDEKFYTNITAFQPEAPNSRFPQKADVIESITMANSLISKPFLIFNHNTREREIVVQDSAYILYQFSKDFDIQWSQEIGEPLKSEVLQIDYYRNKKLQLAFASENKVHAIDRNGEYLPGFPKQNLSENPIEHFSIIDYDNSHNYRYGIADSKGSLYLTDKDLKSLEGWNPKKFDSPLAQPLTHYRIGGRDVFLVLLKSGKIYLLNRRAESLKGFPLDLQSNLGSGFYLKESNDLKNSILSIITENGELIRLNLEGAILSRDQLYKPSTSTVFRILTDVDLSDFVILRHTENKYELLNESGGVLFVKDYFTGKPVYYQYYNLGGDTRLVVFTEPVGSYLYIYDLAGNLVTGRPLSASRPISLWKNGNEYQIYRSLEQNLELISLNF